MEGTYKHSFDRFYFTNKWLHKNRFNRMDTTFIGITRWFCSPSNYAIKFCFFGLECHVWMTRKYIPKSNNQ